MSDLPLAEIINGRRVSGEYLYLTTDKGGRYSIPLGMLGYFRDPYAPANEAELVILRQRPVVERVTSTTKHLTVHFVDGRVLSAPLEWFPRLGYGSPAERQAVEIIGDTLLHWEALDEDIDATTLFGMTGPSAESAASIQRWVARRGKLQEESQFENTDIVVVRDEIPEEFSSLAEAGAFWDTHDSGEYEDSMTPVDIEVRLPHRHRVAIEAETYDQLAAEARHRGVQPETLINLWLSERLRTSPPAVHRHTKQQDSLQPVVETAERQLAEQTADYTAEP